MATTAITIDGFAGAQLGPGDPGYDDARKLYNGLIDKRPALIARCTGAADVAAALAAARERGLEVSVRGGGHNVGGRALSDGGLAIDLSQLRAVEIDAPAKSARVGGGATWREVNDATQEHGLAVTGGVISTTGVAGLTLGGGHGWLMPSLGLALDSLISAEVVTADGSVVTASEEENPELFWAIRGGGGNFGVVPSFEFRLHEVGPMVTGGLVAHPLDAAPDLLRFVREWASSLPDELMIVAALVHAPDGSGAKLGAVAVCHLGSPEQAERDLAPLLAHGQPAMTQIGPMPYAALATMLDAGYPYGSLNHWKAGFFDELADDVIEGLVEAFEQCPVPLGALVLEHFHGEVTRIPVAATACEMRRPGFQLALTSVWLDPAQNEAGAAWARDTYGRLEPLMAPFRYVNYLGIEDGGDDALETVYSVNLPRLRELKRRYDPENVFRLNVNVKPA
jgi:FAD/FMN-containing dehydrogenase